MELLPRETPLRQPHDLVPGVYRSVQWLGITGIRGVYRFGLLQEDQTGDLTLTLDAPSLRAVGPVVSAFTRDALVDLDGTVWVTVDASGSVK